MKKFFLSLGRLFVLFCAAAGLVAAYLQIKPLPPTADTTSIVHLTALGSALFASSVEVLYLLYFAPAVTAEGPPKIRIVSKERDLNKELYVSSQSVVATATDILVVTGSRSREIDYLKAIENKVMNSEVKYVRILGCGDELII